MDTSKHDNLASRRSFLKTVSSCSGVYLFQPFAFGSNEHRAILRFGLIADVHQDVIHDAPQRVKAFVKSMHDARPDFVCQLGDFCQPHERNQALLASWEQFDGPRYHVLGNHDMDGGSTREQAVAFLGMPARYYSFDRGGVHIMVLDGNDPGGKAKGYKRFIAKAQMDWIGDDLKATSLPTLVFVHQPLDGSDNGVENGEEVRKVLEAATTPTGRKKVVACFCGHKHDDHAADINGIHYIRINSASYTWLGGQFKHESYGQDIHRRFPWISHTAPYKVPLWAFVEIDLAKGRLSVTGKKTDWVGPTPWERGVDQKTKNPNVCSPRISDRAILL